MAVIALCLGFRVARRDHHGAGTGVAVATPGAARRGRPDGRVRPARGLLPRHSRVRRRADRAGAHREQPRRRRSPRSRRPIDGHDRVVRRRNAITYPGRRRCGICGNRSPRRSASWSPRGRTSSWTPAGSAWSGSPRTAARRCRPCVARQRHNAARPVGPAVVGRGVPASGTRLAPVGHRARRRRSAVQRPRGRRGCRPARHRVPSRRSRDGCGVLARSTAAEALRDQAPRPRAQLGDRLDPLDDHRDVAPSCSKEPDHDHENALSDLQTPLAGLPLFVQTVPPVVERNGVSRPVWTVARLTTVGPTLARQQRRLVAGRGAARAGIRAAEPGGRSRPRTPRQDRAGGAGTHDRARPDRGDRRPTG